MDGSQNDDDVQALIGGGSRRRLLAALLGCGAGVALTRSAAAAAIRIATTNCPRPAASPGQSLGITSVPNLRDVGGYATGDGAVIRTGLVYRSDQLNPIRPDDRAKVAALGLATVFDLRTAEERAARPDQLPAGVRDVWLNVLADQTQAAPAQLQQLLANPTSANEALGGGQAQAMFAAAYRSFVALPSAKAAYSQLFTALGARTTLPGLFHCTTGKDRTGWAAAALLSLLGVPPDVVLHDFLRSNDYILPAYQPQIAAFVAAGGDPTIPPAILGVQPAYLAAAFDELQTRYGTVAAYFAEGLGIDAAGQSALRTIYRAEL